MSRVTGRSAALAAAAVWLAMGLTTSSFAAGTFRPRIGSRTDSVDGKVVAAVTINDQPALVYKTTSAGHGPAVRAQTVADRLQALVANGLAPGEIGAQRVSGSVWALTVHQGSLTLVTPQEAAAHHLSSAALAQSWVTGLRRLLAEPALTFFPAGVTIPSGETRLIKIGGAALTGDIIAQDTDTAVSQSRFDPTTRTLTVRGLATGHAAISLKAGDAAASVPIVVMKYAAQVLPAVTVSVTGQPSAPADVVTQGVYAGLARAVNAEPGAQIRVTSGTPDTATLPVDGWLTVPLSLHIAGPELLPVEAKVSVTVENASIQAKPASALFYSNNPEQVKHGQVLFSGRLQPFRSVRLDYHHQNMSGSALVFHTDLINGSESPVAVHVLSGLSLPGVDTVQVGRRAGASFLKALDGNVGLIFNVPPHARVPLVTQRFGAGLTVSGIVQLQQVDGPRDAITLQVAADGDEGALISPVGRVILAALPGSRLSVPLPDQPTDYGSGVPLPTASSFVFGPPQIALRGSYAVGGKWSYVRIGHTEALKDATGKITLFGNYGADYEVTLTLTNPTAQARPIAVLFAPEAGLAAGIFRVDGGPVLEFAPTPPPQELQIAKYVLAPGETRTVSVETIPLNGSSYPLSIITHAL